MKKTLSVLFFSLLLLSPCAVFANQMFTLTTPVVSSTPSLGPVSPNQLYLPAFLTAFEKANKNNPYLSIIEKQIIQGAATSTNLVTAFIKASQSKATAKIQASNSSLLDQVFSLISFFFMPTQAFAAIGLPFGGPLVYTFPCTCDPNIWMIFIGPTSNPLTSYKFLAYELGSELFLYHNIPYAPYLLGAYEPTPPVCYVGVEPYCYPVTTQGLITPVVGSSL